MIYLNDANLQPLQLVLRSNPGAEYSAAGNDCRYPKHSRDGKGSRTVEICNNCSIKFTTLVMYPFSRNILIKELWLDR